MKKFLAMLLAVVMVFALVACGKTAEPTAAPAAASADAKADVKPIELKMNVTTGDTSVWMVAAKGFKERVEAGTDGRYIISIYGNEQLSGGDMVKGCEMLFTGVTDCDLHSCINMTGFEEKLSVVTMPWLFSGPEDVDRIVFNGPGGDYIMDLVRSKGAEPLAMAENGFRQLTNSVKEIKSPDDLKGMKIRVPAMNMYINLFKLLGADATMMNFSEVFTALQQNTIDGEENPLDTIRSASLQEVQKYMTMWYYSYDPTVLSVSSKVWNSLSDADKEVFKNAAVEACADQVAQSRAMDDEIIQQFKDAGMTITYLSEEEMNAFKEAAKPIYDEYRDILGEDALAAFGYTFD